MRKLQIATILLKHAGLAGDTARGLVAAGKGFLSSGKHISDVMAAQGVHSPVAHFTAKALPLAAVAYGGKKAYESETAQKLRYRLALHKQRKAAEQQQRGR